MTGRPAGQAASRARARDLGLAPGALPTGPVNAITDVPGVRVGHGTLIAGSDIRTGVTAIVHDALLGGVAGSPGSLPAGLSIINGFGKIVGSTQLTELGAIETPVLLTATLSVFRVADALLSYLRSLPGNEELWTLNPVVAETNDGYLSDIWARPITERHVQDAISGAAGGPVAEGCVGAGTGTSALGFKAGIGTSSRVVNGSTGPVALGALVQSNFGRELTVLGVPVIAAEALAAAGVTAGDWPDMVLPGGSCVIVLATDAGLDARQLTRLANRGFAGMARTGADFSGRSGDYTLAFSTAADAAAAGRATGSPAGLVSEEDLDLIFAAAIEATEEAILNSLFMAVTTSGFRGHVRHAVPLDYVRALVTDISAGRSES